MVGLKGLNEARAGLQKLIQSPLTPAALELLNPEGTRILNERLCLVKDSDNYMFLVRFMDLEKAVEWQVQQLEGMWREIFTEGVVVSSPLEQERIWQLLREDSPWQRHGSANSEAKGQLRFLTNGRIHSKTGILWERTVQRGTYQSPYRKRNHSGVLQLRFFTSRHPRHGLVYSELEGSLETRERNSHPGIRPSRS